MEQYFFEIIGLNFFKKNDFFELINFRIILKLLSYNFYQ